MKQSRWPQGLGSCFLQLKHVLLTPAPSSAEWNPRDLTKPSSTFTKPFPSLPALGDPSPALTMFR